MYTCDFIYAVAEIGTIARKQISKNNTRKTVAHTDTLEIGNEARKEKQMHEYSADTVISRARAKL